MITQYQVKTAHCPNYPNPITFEPGERLVVGREDDEYPGWIWVQTPTGNSGWAPAKYLTKTGSSSGIAKAPYCARELNTQTDELLEFIQEESGWLQVKNQKGDLGWVPKETVSAI